MEWGDSLSFLRRGIILAVAIIAYGLLTPTYGQTKGVTLLLEQSPVKGGDITPVAGMYHFEPGSQVTLTATPKPGYKFLHWLGDVSDPSATKTVVLLNKPKVIVAVFEQNEHRLSKPGGLPAGGGAGGGLFPTPTDLRWPGGFSAGGGSTTQQTRPHTYVIKGNESVPEPATGVLLLVGGFLVVRRRSQKVR